MKEYENQHKFPDGWEAVILDDILKELETGSRPRGGVQGIQAGVPSIGGEHLQYDGSFDFSKIKYVPKDFYNSMNRGKIKINDVLVVKDGATTGKTSFVSEAFPYSEAAVNEHVFILRTYENHIQPQYLFYWMMSLFGQTAVKDNFQGVAQGGINTSFTKNSLIVIAPTREQKRIVEAIETQFTRLDAAVKALEQAQIKLKRYRASVLQAACECRLVPTEAELAQKEGRDYEPADQLLERILVERRAKWEEERWEYEVERAKKKAAQAERKAAGLPYYIRELEPEHWQDRAPEEYEKYLPKSDKWKDRYDEPQPPDIEDLSELPEGWVWATTGYLCDCIVPNRDKPKSFSGNIPWVTLPDFDESSIYIRNSKTDLGLSLDEVARYKAKIIPKDSVVMSCVGRFGITGVVTQNLVVNQQLHAFIVIEDLLDSRYLAYALKTQVAYMEKIATATTISYLNKSKCNSVPIPLPPINEQKRIVDEIERHLSVVNVLEETVSANLIRAERMRQAILKKAFEGRLVEQRPEDEDARELMERIGKI